MALEGPTGKHQATAYRSGKFSMHSRCETSSMCFFYLKGAEEEDDFVPVFETQVPDCEHNRDSQYLEQSELVKIEHDRKCSTHTIFSCFLKFSAVLPRLCT